MPEARPISWSVLVRPFQSREPVLVVRRPAKVILGGGEQPDDAGVSLDDRTWVVRLQERRDEVALDPPLWDGLNPTSRQLSRSFRTVAEFIAFAAAAFAEMGDGLERATLRIANYLREQRATDPGPIAVEYPMHFSDGRKGRRLNGWTMGAGLVLLRNYPERVLVTAEYRSAQRVILLNMARFMPLGDIVEDKRLELLTVLAHELFHAVMDGPRTTTAGLGIVEDADPYAWEYQLVRFWEEGIGTALGLYVREVYKAFTRRDTAAANSNGAYGAAYWRLGQQQVGFDRNRFPPEHPEIAQLIAEHVVIDDSAGTKNWQYPLWDDTQGVVHEPPERGAAPNPRLDYTSASIYQSWRFFANLLDGDMRWVGDFVTRLGERLGPEHHNRTAQSLNELYFEALRDAMERATPGDERQSRLSTRFANVVKQAGRWSPPQQWRAGLLVYDATAWTATLDGAVANGAVALTMPLHFPVDGVVIAMVPSLVPPLTIPGVLGLKPMSALSLRLIFPGAGRYAITLPRGLRSPDEWRLQFRISGQTDDDRWLGLPINGDYNKTPATIEFETRVEFDLARVQYHCADIDLFYVETRVTPARLNVVKEWSFTINAVR